MNVRYDCDVCLQHVQMPSERRLWRCVDTACTGIMRHATALEVKRDAKRAATATSKAGALAARALVRK